MNEGFHSIKDKRDYIEKEISLQMIDEQIQALDKQLKDAIDAEKKQKSRRK